MTAPGVDKNSGDLPKTLAILREACTLFGVRFEVVDTFSGFVARISRDDSSFPVCASKLSVYPINRATSASIARDKTFAHYVLKKNGYAVPKGDYFFLGRERPGFVRPPGKSFTDAEPFARSLSAGFSLPLIVKPNAGSGARFVKFIVSGSGLSSALGEIATVDEIALVQCFVDAPEFRLFLLDGEIAFAYRKSRAYITGDGNSSVRLLCNELARANPKRTADLVVSPYLLWSLTNSGLTLESVLPMGKQFQVDAVSNISAGGRFAGFVEPSKELRSWALRIAQTVSLRVTGIDVFSASKLRDPNDIVVTDVNGSPNLGTLYDLGYRNLVMEVWRQILDKTFDASWPTGF